MFESKLHYLQQQNSLLRRQNAQLMNIFQPISQDNQRSLIFQLTQQNNQLIQKIERISDELLLEKSARLIEKRLHEENLQQLNQAIFELKQQIKQLEGILKDQSKVQQELGAVEKWFRAKLNTQKQDLFHTYAEPVLLFNILEEMLESMQGREQPSLDGTCEEGGEHRENSDMGLNQSVRVGKWFQEDSQIYFMRKKRKENLRLQLKQAKLVQLSQNSIKFKEKEPLTNVFLLKQSYVALIADFQKQRKRILLCERYIDELENRNRLLISSLTNSK